jgi:hypothetical protein
MRHIALGAARGVVAGVRRDQRDGVVAGFKPARRVLEIAVGRHRVIEELLYLDQQVGIAVLVELALRDWVRIDRRSCAHPDRDLV